MVRVPEAQSDCCHARQSKATYIQSLKKSPPQSRSQAVVCVSKPRMYLRSGYFLVTNMSNHLMRFQLSLAVVKELDYVTHMNLLKEA